MFEYKDRGYQYGCAYSIKQDAEVNIASFKFIYYKCIRSNIQND